MNKQASFQRKVAYFLGIVILLFPLAFLSRPATVTEGGGLLSQKKQQYGLSQASLGEIDPASETMKLATLGLRGLAVNQLWRKADEYKKKEDWTNLTATLEQLARLQPNIITFWKFQSWNVSYNVSVQFDDYRDRYYYVREGIEFLQQGVQKNKENRQVPQLWWDLGWFVGHKIGRADESVQYRELFKNDDEFHGDDPPPGSDERDNWLVSKKEYNNGIISVQEYGKSIGKKSEKIFYSSPAKSQMSYAEAIENEGEFAKGQNAWKVASDDWSEFGDRWIEHSTGRRLQLGHEDELAAQVKELEGQLSDLAPGLRDKMVEERRAQLSEAQRTALHTPEDKRTDEQWALAGEAEQAIQVNDLQLAKRLESEHPELRKQVGILVQKLADMRTNLIFTDRYKSDANYDYWKLRAEFEQTDTAVEARSKIFEGKKAWKENQDTVTAKKLYDEGFVLWNEVLQNFPELRDPDGTTGDDLMVFIVDYRDLLNAKGDAFPDDFLLWDIIENFDVEDQFSEELAQRERRKNKPAEESSDAEQESAPASEDSTPATDESATEPAAEEESTPAEMTEESAGEEASAEEAPAEEPAEEATPTKEPGAEAAEQPSTEGEQPSESVEPSDTESGGEAEEDSSAGENSGQ
ncbi:ICP22 family protein [Aeoliella mucimassa]|uniref:IRE (Iron responsive element) n=1 Tax=Aeoliella mucimassa TaxID=2527972 RepID=A0A518ARW8_9BACT|nr:hypothetical protein [Aeoliella mucimassa]QDU57458.1 hypothetical protein Pan181_36740 [Aeoliella mucimassa]